MSEKYIAERLADTGAFAALQPEWWDLWRRVPSATPFQSPAWLVEWWRHFHPGELFAVTIRYGGRLVGLAPFYIEDGPHGRRILPVGISLSDYLDVLLDPAHAGSAGRALVDFIAEQGARWDEWDLEELALDAAALALPVPTGCAETLVRQSACPVIELPPEAASLWDVLSAPKRRDCNLAKNRAGRRGEVLIQQADAGSASAFLDILFRLHGARWNSRGEAGVTADRTVQHFHHAVLPGLLEADLLRLYVLRIDGVPAAAHYGFSHRERSYHYLTGFDPAFSYESPGVIVLVHAFERALAEGVREFHLLRGQEPYKYKWGAVDRWNQRRSFRPLEAADRG